MTSPSGSLSMWRGSGAAIQYQAIESATSSAEKNQHIAGFYSIVDVDVMTLGFAEVCCLLSLGLLCGHIFMER
jgi:hypothetical protein